MKGLFISFEGPDGSGKTTQINMLREYIQKEGYDILLTREPGGTRISEQLRSIILNPDFTEMGINTEMLLYAASRAQLVEEVIRPALDQGKIVICDRFIDSTYAYQGYGRGISLEVLEIINKTAIDDLMPDITLFFECITYPLIEFFLFLKLRIMC
jgi:dTMP kinase